MTTTQNSIKIRNVSTATAVDKSCVCYSTADIFK